MSLCSFPRVHVVGMFLFRSILVCGLLFALTVEGVEWDCAETAGVFDRTNDCDLGSTVYLTQSLTVNGRLQLTTIRAPSGARHFYVYKTQHVLTIKRLKLVGSGTAVPSSGGSVYAYLGTIISTICWFQNNKATIYVGVKGIRNEDSRKLHWTDATGLFCLLLTAWSGLFFNMTPTCDQDEPACFVTLICVLIINIGFFFYCIHLLRDYLFTLVPRMVTRRTVQPPRSEFITNPMFSNTKTHHHPVLVAQSRRSKALKNALA